MDTTALIQLGNNKKTSQHYLEMLRFLNEERGVHIGFPDIIIREFTGLSPESQQQLIERAGQAITATPPTSDIRARSDINGLIREYTCNSPCLSTRNGYIPGRRERNETFLAMFMPGPQGQSPRATIIETDIGRQLAGRTIAEIEMAAGHVGEHAGQYCISFEDAAKLAPDYFHCENLRLTYRAAHNLGWFSTEELKTHLNTGRHITLAKTLEYIHGPYGFQVDKLSSFITSDVLTAEQKADFCVAFNKATSLGITPEALDKITLKAAIDSYCPDQSTDKLEYLLKDIKDRLRETNPLKHYEGHLHLDKTHPLYALGRDRSDGEVSDPYLLLGELATHNITEPQKIEAMGRLWKLTLSDMFHSGLLPKHELIAVADAMGFTLPVSNPVTLASAQQAGLLANDWHKKLDAYVEHHPAQSASDSKTLLEKFTHEGIECTTLARMGLMKPEKIWPQFKNMLIPQGFFERHVTIDDAKRIAALDAENIHLRFPAMSALASAHALADIHRQEFNRRCRDLLSYEKVFSQALLNGAITINEFMRIAQKTGAIYSDEGFYKTRDEAIKIRFNGFQPERSRVSISAEGFSSRLYGKADANETIYLLQAHGNEHSGKKQKPSYSSNLGDLLQAAQGSMYETNRLHDLKYHRLFDAILWPAVRKDAFHVREMARDVLGDVRLRQLEMDFAAKHFRAVVKRLGHPPYETPYTCLHANCRADQWDLGELSVLESILATPHSNWTVINTDRELTSTLADKVVNSELIRKKPDYHAAIQKMAGLLKERPKESSMTNLSVDEFMDKLGTLTSRVRPDKKQILLQSYDFVPVLERRIASMKLGERRDGGPESGVFAERVRTSQQRVILQPDDWRQQVKQERITNAKTVKE